MGEWRDIVTAPKMKTILLFAVTDTDDEGHTRNWKMATGFYHTGADCWEWGGQQLRKYDIHPTHWQPLPRPPIRAGQKV